MPKEIINDEAGAYDLHVGWSPGKDVQVGMVTASGDPLVTVLQTGSTPEESAVYAGIWGHLDRDGCNRAIRAMRRARDAAYGADA